MKILPPFSDFDGFDHRVLTDVERLQKISQGKPAEKPVEGECICLEAAEKEQKNFAGT